ncbi:putative phage tail assembly chaperone [Ferrimonas senticii]|uniref:putative phage tail assembly chaperone n=1 Tax=Ferrimonas senticii TaxID=394566 RepID=UPI0003F6B6A3|nr:putative phage tail assembly chaperone [Ferrimonas senticii]
MKKSLTLTADGNDYTFIVTTESYNRIINGAGKNLAGTTIQFLQSTIAADQRDDLTRFMDENPAAPQAMAEVLLAEFAPRVDVALKR